MDKQIPIIIIVVAVIAIIVLILTLNQTPTEEEMCGDGFCHRTENCTSCPEDCECLPEPVQPGSEEKCPNGVWCEQKNSCIGENEHCITTPFGESIADEANELWGGTFLYPDTNESSFEGWLRASLNVPNAAEYSNICFIFMKGEYVRELESGATFNEGGPVTIDKKEVCEIVVKDGPVEPCGELTIHIDLASMAQNYDSESDNWQDFFKCSTDGSTYCQNECDAMLETLMVQERTLTNITQG